MSIFFEQLRFRTRFAAQFSCQVVAAIVGELLIERLEIIEPRNWHHEIAAGELDQAFCVTLFVRASDQTEMMRVKIVRLKTEKFTGRIFPASSHDLRYGNFRVVVIMFPIPLCGHGCEVRDHHGMRSDFDGT